MNICFTYSTESEIDRIKYTLQNLNKYREYGYKLNMPEKLNINSDLSEINNIVSGEMNASKVSDAKENIESSWKNYGNAILGQFKKTVINIKVIEVVLTKYGVGGSYNPTGKIIINVNYNRYFENFCHELTHILIEDKLVQKNKLSHTEKESIVDYLMMNLPIYKKLFKDYKYQRISTAPKARIIQLVDELVN